MQHADTKEVVTNKPVTRAEAQASNPPAPVVAQADQAPDKDADVVMTQNAQNVIGDSQ